jgi:hypothetical protein
MPNLEFFIAAFYGDRGKPALTDPAELVAAAAADAGVTGVPGTVADLRAVTTSMDVSAALWRRGALLFQLTGNGAPRVAVSLGNGQAIESRPGYGVALDESVAGYTGWTAAGWLPGIEAG